MAVHKKHEEPKEEEAKKTASTSEPKEEAVVVSDVVTETPVESSTPVVDPLTDFKEKMTEEENPNSDMPAKKNFMWPILFVFVIAILLLGGIFVYKKGMVTGGKVNVVTLTPTPTLTSTPTVAEVDLSKYQIKILNGSEIEGEAGRQKDNLEGEGFTVSSVGNASKSDYTETIIQAKEDVDKDFLDKLTNVLEESFVVGEMEELPEDADSDIIVIIGSETN